ncbi:MAG: hypothetical protein VR70_17760 [Rhodospirillaceae bacterium BRH_c57]|nr:MAG: hypothetical protein VR70_17760 [Rhodospirillaceae bacterium BRH_c57]
MERLFGHIGAAMTDPVTGTLVALIVGAFVLFLFLLWRNGPRSGALGRMAPGVLTSLGVLGTFAGIFVGLMEFDVSAIDRSVPLLLEGMKLAFLTSLVGISTAILFKVLQPFLTPQDGADEEATGSDLLVVLKDIRDGQRDSLEKLRQSITGDGDGSLSTQLAKLRTTTGDGFADLRKDFQTFAEKIAEDNSQALIDALQEVIRDFNAKINEQFGENFKHLNEAVGKLLVWQENYRVHVETLTDRFEQAGAGIAAVEAATREIAAQSKAVPEAMSALGDMMEAALQQLDDLESHLEAFATLREKAVDAFPVIEQNLDRITTGMKTQADSMEQAVTAQTQAQKRIAEELRDAVAAQTKTFASLQDSFTGLQKTATGAIEEIKTGTVLAVKQAGTELEAAVQRQGQALTEAVDAAGRHLSAAGEEQHEAMRRTAQQVEKTMEQTLKHTGDALSKQIEALDAQMQQELTRAIGEMGTKLGSLSDKFVRDYTPLTESLRRLVDTARVLQS